MAAVCEEDVRSLPEQFDAIFELHQELETTEESTASDRIQGRLREGIKTTGSAIQKVNQLELFSRNEDIEEVSTNEVKYMMLSAYLGYFTCLNTHLPRLEAVTKSKMCYRDFLKLCNSYSVTNIRLVEESDDDDKEEKKEKEKSVAVTARSQVESINAMGNQRASKIQQFKEKKQLESRLSELKALVERDYVDDEVKREFYMVQLKKWANLATEEIDNCDLELQMLAHREKLKKSNPSDTKNQLTKNSKAAKPFRPFILTKSKLQKHVFGAGYPSLPAMTVDEFYEQKVKEGTLSESVQGGHSLQNWAGDPDADQIAQDEEQAEKERLQEVDDEETLQRARSMDDWKDGVRRGDGNRHNMG